MNENQILDPIMAELLRKFPLPWHIRGDGPYTVITDSGYFTVAQGLSDDQAKAIIKYAKDFEQQ